MDFVKMLMEKDQKVDAPCEHENTAPTHVTDLDCPDCLIEASSLIHPSLNLLGRYLSSESSIAD